MTDPDPNWMPSATASCSWVDDSGTAHWRVYSTDGSNVIEWAMDGDGGWNTTAFASQGEQVSCNVHVYKGDPYIRVYCTFYEQTIEWCQDKGGEWYQGSYIVKPPAPAS